MTLTFENFELDLDGVKRNQHSRYLGQRSKVTICTRDRPNQRQRVFHPGHQMATLGAKSAPLTSFFVIFSTVCALTLSVWQPTCNRFYTTILRSWIDGRDLSAVGPNYGGKLWVNKS